MPLVPCLRGKLKRRWSGWPSEALRSSRFPPYFYLHDTDQSTSLAMQSLAIRMIVSEYGSLIHDRVGQDNRIIEALLCYAGIDFGGVLVVVVPSDLTMFLPHHSALRTL